MTEEAVYVLEKMAHGFGRMGRSSGRGFYDYEEGEEPELWSGLKVFERRRTAVAVKDLRDRLLYIQAIAALRCLDQGMLESADEAAHASRADWGFQGAAGDVISLLRNIGSRTFIARAGDLATRYGERFDPTGLCAAGSASAGVFGDQQ